MRIGQAATEFRTNYLVLGIKSIEYMRSSGLMCSIMMVLRSL